MEILTPKEIAILKYIEGDHEYITERHDTFIKIPVGLTNNQFTSICDKLKEKGMIQTAYCEGHILQDARVLTKGHAFLDDMAERQKVDADNCTMEKSFLHKLSIGRTGSYITKWSNGVIGIIVDIESNGEFHLIDYIDEDRKNPLYLSSEGELYNSKIIAKGLVGFLLNQYITGKITSIEETYRAYVEKLYNNYEQKKRKEPGAMNRNHLLLFFKFEHDEPEREKIRESESIYQYLTEYDIEWIQERIDGYWKFIEKYKKEQCPMKPFSSLDSFLNLFRPNGVVDKCIKGVELKYDIYDPDFKPSEGKTEKIHQLTMEIIPESDAIEYYAYKTADLSIFNEIDEILASQNEVKIKRLLTRILTPFVGISSKVYPIALCKRCIRERIWADMRMLKTKDTTIISHFDDIKFNNNQGQETYEGKQPTYNPNGLQLLRESIDRFMKLKKNNDKFLDVIEYYHRYLNFQIEWYLREYVHLYFWFVKNLDMLLMMNGIDLLDIQKEFGIYLMEPNYPRDLINCQGNQTYEIVRMFYDNLPNRKKNMEDEERIMNFLDNPYLEEESSDYNGKVSTITISANVPNELQQTDAPALSSAVKQFKEKVKRYGFFDLPKVKVLNQKQQNMLIERIVRKDIYAAAMLYYLEYYDSLKKEYNLNKSAIIRHCALAIDCKGNTFNKYFYSLFCDNAKESYERQNAKPYLDNGIVDKDYNEILNS